MMIQIRQLRDEARRLNFFRAACSPVKLLSGHEVDSGYSRHFLSLGLHLTGDRSFRQERYLAFSSQSALAIRPTE
jgi:hypothetical protein